jgi:hypothetical protein
MTHQVVSSVESSVAACDNLSSNEPPLAVLSSFKNASVRYFNQTFYCNIEGGKSFPNDGLLGTLI